MPVIPASGTTRLASVNDLAIYLQREFTAEESTTAELLLDLVSAAIRSYTGQTITLVEDDTVTLKVKGCAVRLPQHPVVAVTAIESAGIDVLHTWTGGPQVWLAGSLPVVNLSSDRRSPSYVQVTYSHGYAAIPGDIRAVALQVAGRAFGTTADHTGVQSENIGGYAYSVGGAAASGAVGLLAGERQVLDRYKMPAGPISMARR